jgi:hypothetical protein
MKSSIKWVFIILTIVIVLGSVTGTMLYFFVFQNNYTFDCSGYVREADTNLTIANAEIQLFIRKADKTYKLVETVYSDDSGYYTISISYARNNSIVQESYLKIIASSNNQIFDHEFYSSFSNHSTDFLLSDISLLESEGRLFPKRENAHLTYTFMSVLPLTSNPTNIIATIGVNTSSSSALLEIYDNEILIHTESITNNDSYIINSPELRLTKVHSLKLKIIPTESNRLWELQTLELTNLYWSKDLHKIAYIISPTFWADLENRKQILREHGFMVRHYRSPSNWISLIENLDEEENEESIVYLMISSHGNYIPSADNGTGDSFCDVNPDISLYIYSSVLREQMDQLESKRIQIMVESCYSGGFYDDFMDAEGVTIITGSDNEHTTNTNFGFYFYKGINESKMDDMDAFDYAASKFDGYLNQIANPLASWLSWHSFFYP